jgi:hypothetical protein
MFESVTKMKTANIFRAPNNDGTGRDSLHVEIRQNGESISVTGGFQNIAAARQHAKKDGAVIMRRAYRPGG